MDTSGNYAAGYPTRSFVEDFNRASNHSETEPWL